MAVRTHAINMPDALAACALALAVALPVSARTPEPVAGREQITERATRLVAQMTPEEKASQLLNTSPAIPRLAIPAYQWWNEALHGVVGDSHATNYPEPIGMAAAFDAPLLSRVASAIGDEIRVIRQRKLAEGRNLEWGAGLNAWAPNINIFRDPRWGRGQETYGEDPFLTSRLAVAYVTGIQGADPDHPKVVATPKHFAVHSGPEPTRHQDNVEVSAHDLNDTYLPAFRAAVVEGRAGAVMCAYNAINGQPACANEFLLRETLRGQWGFKGYVVSDCDAVSDIHQHHRYAATPALAAAAALRAGMDNECTVDGFFDHGSFGRPRHYLDAVEPGALSMSEVDSAVTRLLATRLATGDLGAAGSAGTGASQVGNDEHRALTLEVAEKSMVLLKNNGVLPLTRPRLRIAVVGPLADARKVLRGNYSERDVTQLPSVLDGLRSALADAEIELVPAGPSVTDSDPVPQTALRSEGDQPGATVRYYPFKPSDTPPASSFGEKMGRLAAMQIDAVPVLTRVEPIASVAVLGNHPILPDGGSSVATGFLVPPVSGLYRLGVRGFLNSLELDGQQLVSSPPGALPSLPSLVTLPLVAGQRYPFRLTSVVSGFQFSELVWKRISAAPLADAAQAALKADLVVAVVGITSELESEEGAQDLPGFKGGDRTSLELPEDQQALLRAVKGSGRPLVVVNMSGCAINLSWAKQHADAIVQAWYPGEAGGTAVGRILSGASNPGGRLPVTFYRELSQLPPFGDYSMRGRTYRYFAGEPVYPFGHGLSYSSFSYENAKVRSRGASMADGVQVKVVVRNAGRRAGDEVAQVYLRFPPRPGVPRIALRGFQRVHLQAGESRQLTFSLAPRDLSTVAPDGKISVIRGAYRLWVGGGQPGTNAAGQTRGFTVAKAVSLPQ